MRARILSIGDELLIGQVVNTNAAWLGERLAGLGVDVTRIVTLGDDEDSIVKELREALAGAELIIITGGLGPTHDDITRSALAKAFEVGLEADAEILEALRQRFQRAGRLMSASNSLQAMVPAGFVPLENRHGTAPALFRQGNGSMVFALPGVPREMRPLVEEHVIPRILDDGPLTPVVRKTLLTSGIPESTLHDQIGDLSAWEAQGCSLAYLPNLDGVRLRLTAMAAGLSDAEMLLGSFEHHVRAVAGLHVFGEGDETLELVIGRMLAEARWRVATAESCTGGLVASRLTDVPGSSTWMEGGVVAYDNRVKVGLLGVDPALLGQHGAVSREVATGMALGVRDALGVEVGIATSGIMGPGGGTEEKPVGTLWYAVSTPRATRALRAHLALDRQGNKRRASTAVLNLLRVLLRE